MLASILCLFQIFAIVSTNDAISAEGMFFSTELEMFVSLCYVCASVKPVY